MEGQAPVAEEGGAPAAGEFEKLAGNIMKGLQLMGEGLSKAGAPEEALAQLEGVMEGFQGVIAALSGGGEPQPQEPKAVPVKSVQGQPVGPQG